MVAEIFFGWAVGQILTDALGLAKRGLTKNEQQEIRARTVERLSADLPPILAKAVGDQLLAEVRGGGELSVALSAQLEPLLGGWFERNDGTRETGEELLARLDLTFARLVELTEQAIVAAAHLVAAQQGGLPHWSTHQKLDQIIDQSSPHVTTDTLIAAPEHMVGRRRELDELSQQVRTVVIHGMGGVGKTALVRSLAAEIRDRFPDARFEVDLHGFTPGFQPRSPDLVLAELLRQVGFRPAEIPAELQAKSERWRAWLSDRAVLLILDSTRSADDVRPLLPGNAPRCLAVVTSRNRLDDLDASYRLAIDILPEPDSVGLLRELSGRDEDYAEIARLCGYLPLALRAVGPMLARICARDLAASMEHVDELDQKVRAAFTISYEDLCPELRRLLRWCSFHPGPDFDAGSAAAIWDMPEPVAAIRLDDLAKRNLLLTAENGRYAFHDLFRTYVRDLAETHDAADEMCARSRLYDRLLQRVRAADAGDIKWQTMATQELEAATCDALTFGWNEAEALAGFVGMWLRHSGKLASARRLYTALLGASERTGDEVSGAQATWMLAHLAESSRDRAQGFQRAFELAVATGDRATQAAALSSLAGMEDRQDDFVDACLQILALSEETGDIIGLTVALSGLADAALHRGEIGNAAQGYEHVLKLAEAAGHRLGQADALVCLANIALLRGQPGRAAEGYRHALVLFEEIGHRRAQARVHCHLGVLAETIADTQAARHAYLTALKIFTSTGSQDLADFCARELERLGNG
jgi:tetratricopeptide (TPR) repeat protein